jgi:hypothetical protein
VGLGGDAGFELVARRIVLALDATLSAGIDGAEVMGRHEHEQDRPFVQRVRDRVAPTRAGRQIFLVEKDLVVAEPGVEVAGQRGR